MKGVYKRTKKPYIRTKESREKSRISALYKKEKFGFINSPETRVKMSFSKKGKKQSKETINKRIKSLIGHSVSEQTRKKIALGNSISQKGKKMSLVARKRMSNSHKGSKCHLWKGGITKENSKIRNSIEIRLWRELVFARDNWTCQKTNQRGGDLVAHHIENFSMLPELRTSIENGITLSKKIHREFHNRYGYKNNSREQLEEFLNIYEK